MAAAETAAGAARPHPCRPALADLSASCSRNPKVGCLARSGATRTSHSWSSLSVQVSSPTVRPEREGSPGPGSASGSVPARSSIPVLLLRRVCRLSSVRSSALMYLRARGGQGWEVERPRSVSRWLQHRQHRHGRVCGQASPAPAGTPPRRPDHRTHPSGFSWSGGTRVRYRRARWLISSSSHSCAGGTAAVLSSWMMTGISR